MSAATFAIATVVLGICLSLTMAGAWHIALHTGKSGWIDAIWTFATGLGGAVAAVLSFADAGITTRQVLVAAMATLWSLRLGIYIVIRTAQGGEDPRYGQLREAWGNAYARRLFWFLQIQAVAALLLALSIMIAARNPAPSLTIFDWLGLAILVLAIAGEGIADSQLATFRANPGNRGKVCQAGLWGASRHPNYFFEWFGWLGYAMIAIGPNHPYPWGWFALAGPLFMYWLLVHASGIPPLEAHMLRSRGRAYEDYQQRVNAFWPIPQRDEPR